MPAAEQAVFDPGVRLNRRTRTYESRLSRALKFISSVRFGIVLLVMLGLACLVGMLVMQQNVDGFVNYYHTLTPAQRVVYGRLKLFDIYHAWYFNALLALLSANIILASIDRFPKTWRFISKPKLTVPRRWMLEQRASESITIPHDRDTVVSLIAREMGKAGWRNARITPKNGSIYVFAQRAVWNRLGAYAVHVALLTIFIGGFLTAQFGTTGELALAPGDSSDRISQTVVNLDRVNEIMMRLPFEITFTDIEQTLIKRDGPIAAGNTIDWITRFTIKDETGVHEGIAQMNRPFDYRGYRFFQASFEPVGRARKISVRAMDGSGTFEDVSITRNGSSTLTDGTQIEFVGFRGNFRMGTEDPNENTTDYANPAAILKVIPVNRVSLTAYALGSQSAELRAANTAVGGHTFRLLDFEKVSEKHILSIQRDPGANVVYAGFVMLFITLAAVFFFSHQRLWAAVEEGPTGECRVLIAGNTNRNQNAFNEKLARFVSDLRRRFREGE